ncbi:hypothetical protein ACFL3Z_02425, partial [Gemmatimonadota bacterium]
SAPLAQRHELLHEVFFSHWLGVFRVLGGGFRKGQKGANRFPATGYGNRKAFTRPEKVEAPRSLSNRSGRAPSLRGSIKRGY